MKKILFLIHDLSQGGAEKVLVNLVNHMDRSKFDITVMALFGGGVNEQFLSRDIRLINCHKRTIRGNSHIMKLFSPKQLFQFYIRERYDIIVSYLEGPCARIVSGCNDPETKLVSWIHIEQHTAQKTSASFRSYQESIRCYAAFHKTICVSETVKQDFLSIYPSLSDVSVLYNTNNTAQILEQAKEDADFAWNENKFYWCGVGKLTGTKGFNRMLRIQKRLLDDGYPAHFLALGDGPLRKELERLADELGITESVTFLGYQTNPYKYLSKCDLFVCASHAEGFSTAATEALICGVPVVTTDVSGMKEMLGENNEYGVITENNEDALYQGIKKLLDDPKLLAHYKKQAALRGKSFRTEHTVTAVEDMLLSL